MAGANDGAMGTESGGEPAGGAPPASWEEQAAHGRDERVEAEAAQSAGEEAPKSSGKPEFAAFLQAIQECMRHDKPLKALNELFKSLRTGYRENLDPNHVDQVLALLQGWSRLDQLTLKILEEERGKRLPPLMKILRIRLPDEAYRALGHEPGDASRPRAEDDGRRTAVLQWIRVQSGARDGVSAEKTPELDQALAMKALVCLMDGAATYEYIDGIYEVLGLLSRTHQPDRAKSNDLTDSHSSFLSEVTKLAESPTFDAKRAVFGLRFASPAREKVRRLDEKVASLQADLVRRRDQVARLERKVADAEYAIARQAEDFERLERGSAEKDLRLAEERARYQDLEQHAEQTSRQRLARQAANLRAELEHEVREARLALDEQALDVPMALERLHRIEKTISRLGTSG